MMNIGLGPEDLSQLEYRVLHNLVKRFPRHVPIEFAVDLVTLSVDYADELDAMGSLADFITGQAPIETEREMKLQPIIKALQRQGLVEYDFGRTWKTQPTLEGRQLVAGWEHIWTGKRKPWYRRTLLPYIGRFGEPPTLIGLGTLVLTIPLGFFWAGKSPSDLRGNRSILSTLTPTPIPSPKPRPVVTPQPPRVVERLMPRGSEISMIPASTATSFFLPTPGQPKYLHVSCGAAGQVGDRKINVVNGAEFGHGGSCQVWTC